MDEELLDHLPAENSRDQRSRTSAEKRAFLQQIAARISKARGNLAQTQRRYKRNYDDRILQRLKNLKPGDYVFREIPEHPIGVNPKLTSQTDGPFEVLRIDWPTVVIKDGGRAIRVNANRLVCAPIPVPSPVPSTANPATAPPATHAPSADPADELTQPSPRTANTCPTRQAQTRAPPAITPRALPPRASRGLNRRHSQATPTDDLYEVEALVDAGVADDGTVLYRVRWKGYPPDQDTWEPSSSLPRELIRAYRRRNQLA